MSEHEKVHEFVEDVADGSMCVCGVPGLYHDDVMARREVLAAPVRPEAGA